MTHLAPGKGHNGWSGLASEDLRKQMSNIGIIKLLLRSWLEVEILKVDILNVKYKPFRPNPKLVWGRAVDFRAAL